MKRSGILDIEKLSKLQNIAEETNSNISSSEEVEEEETPKKGSLNEKRDADSIGTFDSSLSNVNSEGELLQGLDAVRHAYLCDKNNHFLKCMMLSLAAKRSRKDVKKTDKLLQFQDMVFTKRKIKPTIDDIICLGNTIKKFSNRMNMLYDWTQKKKVACFLKWKLWAFGYQFELMRQVNSQFEKSFEMSYRKSKKCNFSIFFYFFFFYQILQLFFV